MRKLIFFDIDGTLISGKANPKFKSLAGFISRIKKKDIVFGVNTNRPWEGAREVCRALKLNGPVILENGASYKLTCKSPEMLVNFKARDLNKKIIKFLNKALPRHFPRISIFMSNNKSLLKNNRSLALVSKNRKYTSSIYIRNQEGIAKKDLHLVFTLLKDKFSRNKCYFFKKFPQEGKIIASNNFCDRIKTMSYVRDRHFPNHEIFLISDEERVSFRKDINFCAVKNASKEYKKMSRFIANRGGEQGIKELLQKITNKS